MVSLAELPVGGEGLTGQPITDLGSDTPLVTAPETATTSFSTLDYGGSLATSQSIFNQAAAFYAAQRAEEARLRQYQANQAQARWAEEQTQTTFTEDLAEAYVDFYEGDTTTAELLTDPVAVINPIGVIPDVLGTDIITGSITAAGGALAPITEPLGEGLGKVILPAVIIGGALLLLK